MIIIKLTCDFDHSFEGWFKSDTEFKRQQHIGMIACPSCNSTHISDSTSSVGQFDSNTIVGDQENKMISEQFHREHSVELDINSDRQYFDLSQNEIKDLSEESIASVLSYLKDISKDKLN